MEVRARYAFWTVLFLCALLLDLGSGSVPLLDPDEARYARTSVEMIRDGDIVVPHFEGRPRVVKPPLAHWIQSSLFRLLGTSERVARLHSLLATLGTMALVGWVARRRFGDEAACWAAAILGTMPLVLIAGRLGTLDALLSVHVMAVVALDMVSPREGDRHVPVAVGALLGLAFLAKGPVGVVVPLLVMLAGRTAAGRDVLGRPRAVLAAAAACAVVILPWGLAFLARLGGGTVGETLRHEVLDSYFAGTAHVQPAWFYPAVVGLGCIPWIGPLGSGLVRAVRERREPGTETVLYAGAGFLAGIVFFSLGRNKLPTYILPLAPLAALVVVWELGRELRGDSRIGSRLLALAMFGFAAALLAFALSRPDSEHQAVALGAAVIFTVGGTAATIFSGRRRPRAAYASAAAASALFLVLAVSTVLPTLARTHSAAWLVREVESLREGRPVVTVGMKVPSISFYLDRVPQEVTPAGLVARIDGVDSPAYVFDEDDLAATPTEALERLREVGRQGKYVVFLEAETSRGRP